MGCNQVVSNMVCSVLMPRSLGDRSLLSPYSDMWGLHWKLVPMCHVSVFQKTTILIYSGTSIYRFSRGWRNKTI